jgi:predicted regulator of Ras-like GTPase activity (Roadblock/LC7/MglB family)
MATLPQLIEEDIDEIERVMHELLLKSDASIALLLDKGGFLITKTGNHHQLDTTTLAALSAASFAATQGIASLVSESNFSTVYQQGDQHSILVSNVDEFCLLAIIFGVHVSVGAVKYYAEPIVKAIGEQMKRAQARTPDEGLDLSIANLADPSGLFKKKRAG